MTPKIRSAQVGYTSEWALAKLFSALQESQVKEQFELSYLCGREGSESEAFKFFYFIDLNFNHHNNHDHYPLSRL